MPSSPDSSTEAMPHLLVDHRVENYGDWRPVFDDHRTARESFGCTGERVFQAADDPDHVVVLLEWDDVEDARRFVDSETLREAMADAGVVGDPTLTFLQEGVSATG